MGAAEHMRPGFQDQRRLILQHKAIAREREQHPGRFAYVADMKSAFDAWKKNHTTETIERLARHVQKPETRICGASPGITPFGGSAMASLRTLSSHLISGLASTPEFLAFSSDGNQIAGLSPHQSGNKRELRRFADTATGEGNSRSQLDGSVGGVASSDGRRMVVRATDRTRHDHGQDNSWGKDRWRSDPYTLHPLSNERPVALSAWWFPPMVERWRPVTRTKGSACGSTPDGELPRWFRTVTATFPSCNSVRMAKRWRPVRDGALRLWDVATGKEQAVVPGDGHSVNGIAFSPDGTRLAAASTGRTVKLWNTVADTEPAILQGHANEVRTVAFSPDGKTLASGSEDGTVRLWDVATWLKLISLDAQRGGAHVIAFSPDGNLLASSGTAADGRGEILLWEHGFGSRVTGREQKTGRDRTATLIRGERRSRTAARATSARDGRGTGPRLKKFGSCGLTGEAARGTVLSL